VKTIIQRGTVAILASCVLACCGLTDLGGPATAPATGPPVRITQHVLPSALLAVLNGPTNGAALTGLVSATAQPNENLTVLRAGTPPGTVVASSSPAPPTIVVPGRPAAPAGGQTSYQAALAARQLTHWRAEVAAGRQADVQRTSSAIAAWQHGLGLARKTSRLAGPAGAAGNLAAESAEATSALAGLEQENGNAFGARRVIVLYCDDLTGVLPAGELSGDVVLVISPFLPTTTVASGVQAELLGAGAAQAAVLGPEVTAGQLAALVTAGLNQNGLNEMLSQPVTFANGSAALTPTAAGQLSKLLPRLREAGVTAVINGYASTPGTAEANYLLSYQRATSVASFFESHDVSASSLIIVGHGASSLVAAGASGRNRRVTVVIEKPPAGS
jgi:outer membrane protein OmpA-like peptidoglycan-associated protein